MCKKDVRKHTTSKSGLVSSLYIQYEEQDTPMAIRGEMEIYNCYNVSCVVSDNRRKNNDWFIGKNKASKLDDRMTGSLSTFMPIVRGIREFVLDRIKYDDECVLAFNPTDEHRESAYNNILISLCIKHDLHIDFAIEGDWHYFYITHN